MSFGYAVITVDVNADVVVNIDLFVFANNDVIQIIVNVACSVAAVDDIHFVIVDVISDVISHDVNVDVGVNAYVFIAAATASVVVVVIDGVNAHAAYLLTLRGHFRLINVSLYV